MSKCSICGTALIGGLKYQEAVYCSLKCRDKYFNDLGLPVPDVLKRDEKYGKQLLTIAWMGLLVFMIYFMISNGKSSTTPKSVEVKPWYSGGTLHRSKCSEWVGASFENRLATSADFLVSVNKGGLLTFDTTDFDQLRVNSAGLVACITKPCEVGIARDQRVAEIASLCEVSMGLLK